MGRPISLTPDRIKVAELSAKAGLFKRDIARRMRITERTFMAWLARGRAEAQRLEELAVRLEELEVKLLDEPKDAALKAAIRELKRGDKSLPAEAACLQLLHVVEGGEGDFKLDMMEAAAKHARSAPGDLALKVLAIRDRDYAPPGQARIGGVRVTTHAGDDDAPAQTMTIEAGYMGSTPEDWADVGDLLLAKKMTRQQTERDRRAAEKRGEEPTDDDE